MDFGARVSLTINVWKSKMDTGDAREVNEIDVALIPF